MTEYSNVAFKKWLVQQGPGCRDAEKWAQFPSDPRGVAEMARFLAEWLQNMADLDVHFCDLNEQQTENLRTITDWICDAARGRQEWIAIEEGEVDFHVVVLPDEVDIEGVIREVEEEEARDV